MRQTVTKLRDEAEANLKRAEEAEEKLKKIEQDNILREQEISSLQHKISLLESDLEVRAPAFRPAGLAGRIQKPRFCVQMLTNCLKKP